MSKRKPIVPWLVEPPFFLDTIHPIEVTKI